MSDPLTAATRVPSPCTGVCRIDQHTGWCAGCVRSLDEIVAWGSASDTERLRVLHAVVLRRAQQVERPGPDFSARPGDISPRETKSAGSP